MKRIIICILLLYSIICTKASNISYDKTDSLIFSRCMEYLNNNHTSSCSSISKAALFFLDKPYVAKTLDNSKIESLTINLREFDCTTFVENILAIAIIKNSKKYSFSHFCKIIQRMRYRNGIVDGFSSRLHYINEWIYQNQKLGIFKNISSNIGGIEMDKLLYFMSSHHELYKQMSSLLESKKIALSERAFNKLHQPLKFIPTAKTKFIQNKIKNGDIIAFVSKIAGLDYSHMGIAYRKNQKLYFINASSYYHKVIISHEPLSIYCLKHPNCLGVSILRINN